MSRNLHFSYRMEIRYSVPVEGGCYTLRTIPESGAVQKVTKLSARMEPGEKVWRSRDPFGNLLQCGRDQGMMERFLFEETGEVTTGLRDSEPAEPYARLVKFRYGGSLVQPGPLLKRFWAGQLEPILAEKNALEQGRIIMEKVHDTMTYAKGRTGMATTAEQALEQGGGVCQDESHVMIALCRLSGITARYVAGFLYGEGESHAWVEVLHDGRWYGLDPTNAIPAGEKHIRIAVGRDVGDCPMNSGIFYGSADQTIQVKVKVW
ncbi:transglutaminase family protein [Acidaminococcus massiliensis]|jgi:transglutaminase-like putative cysteine protease|uniref:transglutaminase family protein n=1 Tax=Acidaminococcus massiliensis TaxID=1852375 RepID=UPI0023F2ABB8|nr:transglutaminase family protein [Acidaminococcus massiliensis]